MTNQVPSRSIRFVPGTQTADIAFEGLTAADALIFDLEDSVHNSRKKEARNSVAEILRSNSISVPSIVRLNGLETRHIDEDIEAVASVADGVLLPMVETAEQVKDLVRRLDEVGARSLPVFLLLETPQAVYGAFQIAGAAETVAGLVFGSVDFARIVGLSSSTDVQLLYGPRLFISMAASQAGCSAFDTVFLDKSNKKGLRRACTDSRRLGFDGKAAITEAQAEVINHQFTPTRAEVEQAQRYVDAFEHEDQEQGLIEVDGMFVDRPVVMDARRKIERAETYGVRDERQEG